MPHYKLTYFDYRGRAEYIRYLFLAAGQEFEDVRVGDDWLEFKPKFPFGQIPVLEVDGKMLAQSHAIARYLAREFGMAGKTTWDQAVVDQYVDLFEELHRETYKEYYAVSEEEKKQAVKNANNIAYPKYLKLFEKALEANDGQYLVGDSLTLADLTLYCGFDSLMIRWNPKLLDAYPKVKAHRQMVESIPKLKEYIKNRKHTRY